MNPETQRLPTPAPPASKNRLDRRYGERRRKVEPEIPPEDGDQGAIGFREIRDFLVGALPLLAIGGALGAAVGVTFLQVAAPQYAATAAVLYDPARAPRFFEDAPWLEPVVEHRIRIDSQVEILTSNRLLGRVVDSLSLTSNPEFRAENVSAENTAYQRVYAARALRKNLRVRRVDTSSVLEIRYRSETPKTAALIANALAAQYIEQQREIAAQTQRSGSAWLEKRLDELRAQLFEAQREVAEFRSDGSSGSLSDSQVTLLELESKARTYRALYESFLRKFTETSQRVTYPVTDSRIISTASTPKAPSFPNATLVLAFSGMLGLLIGGLAAIIRHSLDNTIRNAKQAAVDAQAECFTLPRGAVKKPATLMGALRPLREKLRSSFQEDRADPLVFGFTGADETGDAESLARPAGKLWRQSHSRVLVVNATATRTARENEARSATAKGLSDVLADPSVMNDAVRLDKAGVFVLPRGTAANEGELSDVATKRAMRALGEIFAERFDVVIFALPSARSLDTQAVARHLDGVVVTATYARTPADELKSSTAKLRRLGAGVFGVALLEAPDERTGPTGGARWKWKTRPTVKHLFQKMSRG